MAQCATQVSFEIHDFLRLLYIIYSDYTIIDDWFDNGLTYYKWLYETLYKEMLFSLLSISSSKRDILEVFLARTNLSLSFIWDKLSISFYINLSEFSNTSLSYYNAVLLSI